MNSEIESGNTVQNYKKQNYFNQEPPGERAEMFAPDIFNFPEGYHSPVIFSPNGTEAYYSPMTQNSVTHKMMFTSGVWSDPFEVNFGLAKGIADPVFSPDGHNLYFLSFEVPENEVIERERIWLVKKEDNGWSTPFLTDKKIAKHPTHWSFSLSQNYNLYFQSEINTQQDIYVAEYLDDTYKEPVILDSNINSAANEFCPFISPDENYIIFSRSGENTQKADIYISVKKDDGSWSVAQPFDNRINSAANDLYPLITNDGKYMFFLSTRSGISRIYWINANIIKEFY